MEMLEFSSYSRSFGAGEIIFSEYEPGNSFYLLQSGRVKLVKVIGGAERMLDILSPPDGFGEMAILDNSHRSATVIALDEVKVLEFNSQRFEVLMLKHPQIALRILRSFSKKIHNSKRRFKIITLADPQARVADVFLMLDETMPSVDKTAERREFSVTMEDVAYWAGMGIEDTKGILTGFVNKRRLEVYHDHIAVTNISDFTRLVNSRRKK
ncbi:MAG: Crp/Fnr family transcriptional regulator [Spirochaetes bacterium]|nr:Crp/Fnr family transcriptional regulator [Spirochaetota bacterium]